MKPFLSSLVCTAALICAFPIVANAEITNSKFEEQYLRDKDFAIKEASPALGQQCLQDISKKISSGTLVNQTAKLAFNDNITREVYRNFYWNKSDRGVAFIMPIQVNDKILGNITTEIACFYSLTDSGLEFQLSQQITRRLYIASNWK